MKIKVENLKKSQRLIKVNVEAEKVTAVLNDVYSDIQKVAQIPGFRLGRAPLDLIRLHHEDKAKNEAIRWLVWHCYCEAITQQKMEPVGYPVIIEDIDFNEGLPLTFTIKVDVKPEFKLKSYKGLKIKQTPVAVTDDDVDIALKEIQESLAQYENIENRPVMMGDYVVCDYECFVDGKLVDKNDKLWLYINNKLNPKELLDLLIGAEKNITRETEVVHTSEYQYKVLAGKKALYKVTPREIKKKILPEINDDLAKEQGRFKDLEELKSHLRQDIEKAKKNWLRQESENQIFAELLKSHSLEVPPSLVERQLNHLVENMKLQLLQQGYKRQDMDKDDEDLRKSLHKKAEEDIQLFFIIQAIAKQENIEANSKELEEWIEAISKHTRQDSDDVRKKLEEQDIVEDLKGKIVYNKVVDFLLAEAKKEYGNC